MESTVRHASDADVRVRGSGVGLAPSRTVPPGVFASWREFHLRRSG